MKDIEEFNLYCASVMGYKNVYWSNSYQSLMIKVLPHTKHMLGDPYNDLNQMAKVMEKLLDKDFMFAIDKLNMYLQEGHSVNVKQAFRDFIISTIPEES